MQHLHFQKGMKKKINYLCVICKQIAQEHLFVCATLL